jgi:hypothetical protein
MQNNQHTILCCTPKSHNAVLCKRFHRYLNKAMCISVIDQHTYKQWTHNCLFATSYAWNASAVDSTDVSRSYTAKVRTFRFLLDMLQTNHEVAWTPQQSESVVQHIKTLFPLCLQQKELLKKVLDDE